MILEEEIDMKILESEVSSLIQREDSEKCEISNAPITLRIQNYIDDHYPELFPLFIEIIKSSRESNNTNDFIDKCHEYLKCRKTIEESQLGMQRLEVHNQASPQVAMEKIMEELTVMIEKSNRKYDEKRTELQERINQTMLLEEQVELLESQINSQENLKIVNEFCEVKQKKEIERLEQIMKGKKKRRQDYLTTFKIYTNQDFESLNNIHAQIDVKQYQLKELRSKRRMLESRYLEMKEKYFKLEIEKKKLVRKFEEEQGKYLEKVETMKIMKERNIKEMNESAVMRKSGIKQSRIVYSYEKAERNVRIIAVLILWTVFLLCLTLI